MKRRRRTCRSGPTVRLSTALEARKKDASSCAGRNYVCCSACIRRVSSACTRVVPLEACMDYAQTVVFPCMQVAWTFCPFPPPSLRLGGCGELNFVFSLCQKVYTHEKTPERGGGRTRGGTWVCGDQTRSLPAAASLSLSLSLSLHTHTHTHTHFLSRHIKLYDSIFFPNSRELLLIFVQIAQMGSHFAQITTPDPCSLLSPHTTLSGICTYPKHPQPHPKTPFFLA